MVLQWFLTGSLAWLRDYIAPLPYTEPVKLLYGSSVVLQRFFAGSLAWLRGYIAPLPYTEPVKLMYGSSVVLQWFFTGSLAWLRVYIAPLPYTEPVKLLYGSSVVPHRFFGMTEGLYSTATVYRTCQAPVWFFSGSLAWLRDYIAPLPYTEPVKLLYGSSAVLWHDWGTI